MEPLPEVSENEISYLPPIVKKWTNDEVFSYVGEIGLSDIENNLKQCSNLILPFQF